MKKAITPNDLLLLAYNELPPERTYELLSQIAQYQDLNEEYIALKKQLNILNVVSLNPNPTSVQIVLEESCSSSSLETI